MSDWKWNIENEYLYKLPPAILCDFNRVMDSLPNGDWDRFASRVFGDQIDVRQAGRSERRTDVVMHLWGERKGTVGELLSLLTELQLLRARDIILSWNLQRPSPEVPPVCQPYKSFPPPPSKGNLKENQQTRPFHDQVPAPKLLPRPPPPPPNLDSTETVEAATALKSSSSPIMSGVNNQQSYNAMCWAYEEVRLGTDNFSEALQIGEGGFGHVYHATMRNTEYAVKRLKQDSRLTWPLVKESFKTEVEKLSQYRHPNIVEFAGYSVGGGEHCLLYVFMPNGCLDNRLRCQSSAALSWPQRVSVLLGSAKAIQFLHTSDPRLIHGDVKSSNILLGEHLEPKLGDFGLARFYRSTGSKLGNRSTVACTKTIRGTLAYLPEEYVTKGELGMEIDTYSFGVVLLEVLTGRRAIDTVSQSKTIYLKDLVADCKDEESEIRASSPECLPSAAACVWTRHLDPQMASAATPAPRGALELFSLACRCLQSRKNKRPRMTEVFEILKDLHSQIQASRCDSSTNKDSSAPSLPPPIDPPSASLLQSLDSITYRMSKLEPQEDTYCCPQFAPLTTLPPPQTLCSQGQLSWSSAGSWGPQPSSSQVPCESDDSRGHSQYLSSDSISSPLPPLPLCHPGEAQDRSLQSRSLPGHCQAEGGRPHGGQVSPSGASNEKIVMNAAKQRIVQKMALYEEGRIPIGVVLSSGDLSCGDTCNRSQEPEESDFESIPGETSGPT
ncbi:hypothetical protein AAFF_G00059550 [Aldrovandia affinis]|uniref:Protein kinase domain-containing protein n=1 Tax=Aldrovandia affinis TaxID=143900 RepID=A0AAD7S019_9TELE|nr:hypothetical protein AAFF_G00059550 [Aldrovandia affinis]